MVSEDSGLRQSFLLIACTGHIVTSCNVVPDTQVSQHIAEFLPDCYQSGAATDLRPPFTGASVQSFSFAYAQDNPSP